LFVHAVPDNRGKKDGYYCSLVESRRVDGIPSHTAILSFGYVPAERLPYLKAAFNSGNPEDILAKAKESLARKRADCAKGKNGQSKT
jgi:hypothetical protein